MLRKLMRLVPMPALVVAMLVAGCADQTGLEPDRLSPESAELARGGRDGQRQAERDGKRRVRERRKHDGEYREWKAVVGKLETRNDLNASVVTDGSRDAYVYAHGHALVIPAGAVTVPTKFKMETFKQDLGDGTVIVGVTLKATVTDRKGKEVSVGEKGFLKPVTLYVSAEYAEAGQDLTGAEILWLTNPGEVEPITDSTGSRRMTTRWGDVFAADLEHFSSYILGTPW